LHSQGVLYFYSHPLPPEIRKIAQSVTDLHQIFKDLANLVIDQGTLLDRIDYNVEQVVHQAKKANVELVKAEEAQKSSRATKCIMFFAIAIFIEVLLLVWRFSGD
jgi:syntaxin 16